MASEKLFYVYILTNKSNRVLYVGVTNNLIRRMFEHKHKLAEGFTKKYNLTKLVYYEVTNDIEGAIKREKQLKNWHRNWKINLINQFNPGWMDLSEGFWGMMKPAKENLKRACPEEILNQVQNDTFRVRHDNKI